MDEYSGFPWAPPRVAGEEAELLARADWVFAGTQALFDAKAPRALGKIECLLSGVDVAHFRRPAAGPAPEPPEDLRPLRQKYARLLGYAGAIDMRIDQPLVAEAAARHPDWGWILLGPEAGDCSALRARPNIHLLGQKPYERLPAYFHAWDCALIPFVESAVTRHINPTKTLEYAAAGLPIVARALPDVERFYAEGAFLYRAAEEFEARLAEALSGGAEAKRKLEIATGWADERSWDSIAGAMLRRVEALAAGKSAAPPARFNPRAS